MDLTNGYALRPGFVYSSCGTRSKTPAHRWGSAVAGLVAPPLRLLRLSPVLMTSTSELGHVALHLARHGFSRHVLENRDIVSAAATAREDSGRRGRRHPRTSE
ncbi:hypothetical protein ACH4M4_32255 [Streptomyces sp. NPDC017254]|uniref:hypothetical protein n=1 Tax=unclassified Streptomyces TaxID=2593676 RepID=UPI00379A8E19